MTAHRLIDWIPEAFGIVFVSHIPTNLILPDTFSAKSSRGEWVELPFTTEPIFVTALEIAQTLYHEGPSEFFQNVCLRSSMMNAVNKALNSGAPLDGARMSGPALIRIPADIYLRPPLNPKENNPFAGMDAALAEPTGNVRKRGLKRLLFGGLGFALVFGAIHWLLPKLGVQFTPRGMMIAAIPGAYAALGALEATTGVPYADFARRWDALKGWQRGFLGCGIVAIAAVFIFVIMALFVARR